MVSLSVIAGVLLNCVQVAPIDEPVSTGNLSWKIVHLNTGVETRGETALTTANTQLKGGCFLFAPLDTKLHLVMKGKTLGFAGTATSTAAPKRYIDVSVDWDDEEELLVTGCSDFTILDNIAQREEEDPPGKLKLTFDRFPNDGWLTTSTEFIEDTVLESSTRGGLGERYTVTIYAGSKVKWPRNVNGKIVNAE